MPRVKLTRTDLLTEYRAACEDDNYRGPWRDTKNEAIDDAINHRSKPGNQDHVINIITKKTETHRID